jgi:membrane-bound serine protease (ClpP class)
VANPIVLSLLVTLGFLALLIELKTPGVFIGAGIFILIFSIFFYANFVIGTASGWEVLLFLVGVLFLGVDIVALPGFGLVGILGAMLSLYSLFAALVPGFLPFHPVSPYDSYYEGMSRAGSAALTLLTGFTLSVVSGILLSRFLPDIPLVGALVHTQGPEESEFKTPTDKAQSLIGQTGTAKTDLHPTGKIEINGKTIEARSSSGFIPKGRKVKVIASDFGAVVEEV